MDKRWLRAMCLELDIPTVRAIRAETEFHDVEDRVRVIVERGNE